MDDNLFKYDDPDLQYLVDRVNDYLTDEGVDEDLISDVDDTPFVALVNSTIDGAYDEETDEYLDHDLVIYVDVLHPGIEYYIDNELRYRREFFDQIALGDYIADSTWDSIYNSVFDYIDTDGE